MRKLTLPSIYEARIEALLSERGYSLKDPRKLTQAILKLSDYYISSPESISPLKENWAQAAYLAYYFPLNFVRNLAVVNEGVRVGFFNDLNTLIDFGSGLGSAALALQEKVSFKELTCDDHSEEALELNRALHGERASAVRWGQAKISNAGTRLGVFSYVLTELVELPNWALESEALMILEPSTQQDGRKLLELREKLQAAGFHLWAPCPHQASCPLLHQSQRDWCHDRIQFGAPAWFSAFEKFLPMRNRTLTHSYLLARKTPPPVTEKIRLVGDQLDEKGKTRILMCRGPEREFLSWFPQRMKEELSLYRGETLELTEALEKKSNELRLKSPQQIRPAGVE